MKTELGRRVLLAGVLAAGAAVSLAAGVATAAAEPVEIDAGHGDWGVRESFRNYVEGPVAHGEITVSGGASRNEDGTFRFPVVSGSHDADAGTAEISFGGSVVFAGHEDFEGPGTGPALLFELSDPRIEIEGDAGTLFADVTSKQIGGEVVEYPGVDFATLELAGSEPETTEEGASWSMIPATLTENGAPAFAGFYDPGTELDPVSATVEYASPEPVRPPAIAPARAARVAAGGRARIAMLRCRTGPCDVKTPGRARLRIGGRKMNAKLLAPSRVGAGSGRRVRVELRRGQRRRLARGARGRAIARVTVRSGGARVSTVVRTKLRAK